MHPPCSHYCHHHHHHPSSPPSPCPAAAHCARAATPSLFAVPAFPTLFPPAPCLIPRCAATLPSLVLCCVSAFRVFARMLAPPARASHAATMRVMCPCCHATRAFLAITARSHSIRHCCATACVHSMHLPIVRAHAAVRLHPAVSSTLSVRPMSCVLYLVLRARRCFHLLPCAILLCAFHVSPFHQFWPVSARACTSHTVTAAAPTLHPITHLARTSPQAPAHRSCGFWTARLILAHGPTHHLARTSSRRRLVDGHQPP